MESQKTHTQDDRHINIHHQENGLEKPTLAKFIFKLKIG